MLVKMSKEVFQSVADAERGSACFNQLIGAYKRRVSNVSHEQEIEVKTQFYSELTEGQQALFMFFVFYNHAKHSLDEFYWRSAYNFAQPETWSQIKKGLVYFNATGMLYILEEMERILVAREYPRTIREFQATYNDLNKDSELLDLTGRLNTQFHEISFQTLQLIGEKIKNDSSEFVMFEK